LHGEVPSDANTVGVHCPIDQAGLISNDDFRIRAF